MNNLLKTISESHLKANLAEADLKLLLSSVRDVRSNDTKAADSFYSSLESVLLELRTVTPDNRDAEAFLKPVSKTDYPDYYELIKHPMDLATMLKHVKSRKYKSKQEFAADLNLIWKNCYKYNSGPDHILRGCAARLKRKADHLLGHVSDRPDRITINGLPTPSAPPSSSSSRESPYKTPKINGIVNGITPRDHMPSPDPFTPPGEPTPNTPGPSMAHSKSPRSVSGRGSPTKPSPSSSSSVPFEDRPALIRTPASMSLFTELDKELQMALDGTPDESTMFSMMAFDAKGKGKEQLLQRLQSIVDDDMDVDPEEPPVDAQNSSQNGEGSNRQLKRKRDSSGSHDQRKRPRILDSFRSSHNGLPASEVKEDDLLDSWWEAARSSTMLVGGLPSLPQFEGIQDRKHKAGKGPGLLRKKLGKKKGSTGKRTSSSVLQRKSTKSLLKLMNNNITTLGRVRRTHAKFVALNAASDSANPVILPPEVEEDSELDNILMNEEGWKVQGEVEQRGADRCLNWMSGKVLQHAGFQGSSTTALNVLTSVTSEYLQNVGRTIRFLCDKYSNTMTPEEIILHTLFEGGTTEIQDLERYIKDDVIRHGGRLGDLEKKLVGAYREITSVDVPNDEGIFDDEADQFASGGLADVLGGSEDFLGLRELGIEAEFGLKSLSIPNRLWKGKSRADDRKAPDRAHAGEPPLPFPPPPPFIPLESSKVDAQIGLLKDFYQEKFKTLASTTNPPPPNPTASQNVLPSSSIQPMEVDILSMSLVLPDDPPNPTRCKISPLGLVIATNPVNASNKKKGKAKEVTGDKDKDKQPETSAAGPKKKETKKKKSKEEPSQGGANPVANPSNAEVNGTGPKKKAKSAVNDKKSVNGGKTQTDVPPAIIASA